MNDFAAAVKGAVKLWSSTWLFLLCKAGVCSSWWVFWSLLHAWVSTSSRPPLLPWWWKLRTVCCFVIFFSDGWQTLHITQRPRGNSRTDSIRHIIVWAMSQAYHITISSYGPNVRWTYRVLNRDFGPATPGFFLQYWFHWCLCSSWQSSWSLLL